jgi:hypothetical protein
MNMFNVGEYIQSLNISPDDERLVEFKRLATAKELILDDAYLCRASFWGEASAMENQLEYLGGNYLPNLERRINQLEGSGFLSENDLSVSWFANEDQPHVNDEVPADEKSANVKDQIDQVLYKMSTAAIGFIVNVHKHDEISKQLEQLSYTAIKARAAAKRAANR